MTKEHVDKRIYAFYLFSHRKLQFCKSEKLPLLYEKSRAILLVLVGLMAVWQSDEILVDCACH